MKHLWYYCILFFRKFKKFQKQTCDMFQISAVIAEVNLKGSIHVSLCTTRSPSHSACTWLIANIYVESFGKRYSSVGICCCAATTYHGIRPCQVHPFPSRPGLYHTPVQTLSHSARRRLDEELSLENTFWACLQWWTIFALAVRCSDSHYH